MHIHTHASEREEGDDTVVDRKVHCACARERPNERSEEESYDAPTCVCACRVEVYIYIERERERALLPDKSEARPCRCNGSFSLLPASRARCICMYPRATYIAAIGMMENFVKFLTKFFLSLFFFF